MDKENENLNKNLNDNHFQESDLGTRSASMSASAPEHPPLTLIGDCADGIEPHFFAYSLCPMVREEQERCIEIYGEKRVMEIIDGITRDTEDYACLSPEIHRAIISAYFDELYGFDFFVSNYESIKTHFRNMIEEDEGHPCCGDKADTLMKELSSYILSGRKHYPMRHYEAKYTFHLPQGFFKNPNNVWFVFDALLFMHHGRPEKFLKIYQDFQKHLKEG